MVDSSWVHRMRVQFHKTDERRYGVVILRDGGEPLRMPTAPGNDPLMPHDLQHFIAEQELGIELGIFGQVAAGGTAGTFHGTTHNGKAKRRSKNLSKNGRNDAARSERATYLCVARINARMEQLSQEWAATPIGGSLELRW